MKAINKSLAIACMGSNLHSYQQSAHVTQAISDAVDRGGGNIYSAHQCHTIMLVVKRYRETAGYVTQKQWQTILQEAV